MTRILAVGLGAVVSATCGAALPASAVAPRAESAHQARSTIFAGYEVDRQNKISTAIAQFRVPTVTCTQDAGVVGPLVALTANPVTKGFAGGSVGAVCVNGKAEYLSIITIANNVYDSDVPIKPHDLVTVTVRGRKSGAGVTFVNLTTGKSKHRHGAGTSYSTASIGMENQEFDASIVDIDPFGKVQFSKAEVNGKSLAAERASAVKMVRGKTLLAAVSGVSHKKSFTVTFKHI